MKNAKAQVHAVGVDAKYASKLPDALSEGAESSSIEIPVQMNTEKNIQDSEAQYRRLFESAKDGILILDADSGIVEDVNPFLMEMLGYSKEMLVGKKVWELGFFKDIVANHANFLELQRENYIRYEDLPLEKADGERADVEFVSNVYFVGEKKVIQCNIRNITDRKRVERALHEIQMDLARAQTVAHVGSWRLDIRKKELLWSAENHVIFGIPDEGKINYDRFLDTVHPDDRHFVGAKWRSALSGEEYDVEHRIIVRGEVKWIREKAELEFDGNGEAIGAFGTTQDVTDRKKTEEALQKLNRTLKALSSSNKTMMYAADESKYINDVCKIIADDCGYPMVWIGFIEDDKQRIIRPVASAGFEEGYLEMKIIFSERDGDDDPTGTAIRTGKISKCRNMFADTGSEPWRKEAVKRGYSSSIVLPLTASMDNGKTFGAVTIYSNDPDYFSDDEVNLLSELVEDLSHGIMELRFRKHANEIIRRDKESMEKLIMERSEKLIAVKIELEKAKRLSDIGTLAATVAHELRNPLAAMSLALAVVKRKPSEEMVARQFINIEKMINDSNQIINNLLFYSKLRSPHYEKCDLHAILEGCVESQKRQPQKGILFNIHFESDRDIVIADPLQMREVFNNLLNNAADAVPPSGGRIDIEAHSAEGNVEIIINDNGHGIDKQLIERVFDPFFTTKAKGTGLGLTVCHQIVNMHNGKISIYSELDKGTTVTIVMPKRGN